MALFQGVDAVGGARLIVGADKLRAECRFELREDLCGGCQGV
jgi:hypothetical protein